MGALAAMTLFALACAGGVLPAAAAEAPPAAVAAATSVTDAVTRATASEDLQRAALAHLAPVARWRELAKRTAALEAELDGLAAGIATKAELIDVVSLARQLRLLHRDASTIVDELGVAARQLEHDGSGLDDDARKWQERLPYLEARLVPAPVLERARSIAARLAVTSARVRERRDELLLALGDALAVLARIEEGRVRVAEQEEQIRARRTQLERASLWQLAAAPGELGIVATELRATGRVLATYVARDRTILSGLFLGFLALTGWLFTRGSGQDTRSAQRAYGRPVAAALLITLMSLWWLAPNPPILFYEALLVLVPIPAAMVARNALAAPIPLTLYGIAVATMLIALRGVVEASAVANRVLLLLQVASIAVPVAVDVHRGRLQRALPWASPGSVRAVALIVLAGSVMTALSVVFGFTGPARQLRAGMGSVLGFSLAFGATAAAVYGAVLSLISTPLLQWLRCARDADPALLRTVRRVLGAAAVAGVAIVTLGTFGLIPTMFLAGQALMSATWEVGTVSIAAKAVATAVALIVGTVVLTGVTGFILDREILPRLHLRPGAGYAVITFTRWTMIIVGAALTLAALGIDMAKVTLLASAVGVGIGFGLQNVVNNFVSGLILIVERPVGVGDLIEIGPLLGEVKRIGIRSSTVRTGQGAEVIVPNGELVSKEVVNWTRSDRQRRYDIDVGVAYGSEPERVMRLLVEAAKDLPEIMKNPAPQAMFKGFGDSSLDFRLLAWVETVDIGLQAQNALRVAILRKLEAAGIDIPFPQRDLHIHSVDAGTGAGKVAG
jgi:potassium efflux system protein